MRTFTLASLMSVLNGAHCVEWCTFIVWNKEEQLSSVCFLYFSLCLTFLRLVVTSELPTAVSGRRSDFPVLHCGAAGKKKHEKLSYLAEV